MHRIGGFQVRISGLAESQRRFCTFSPGQVGRLAGLEAAFAGVLLQVSQQVVHLSQIELDCPLQIADLSVAPRFVVFPAQLSHAHEQVDE